MWRRIKPFQTDIKTGCLTMDKYKCKACGYVYDPKKGDSKKGVEPEIPFEDLDNKWICPKCHAKKNRFQKYI